MSKVVKFAVPKEVEGTPVEEDYLSAAQQVLKEQTVLRLFEQGTISTGYAAQMLGLNRFEFLDLLAKRQIPVLNYSEEELEREVESVAELSHKTKAKGKSKR